MRKIINSGFRLFFTQTARDTFLVMIANAANGLTGLVLAILIARNLTVADFGTFSSLMNLILILIAIVDLGMTQTVVNFVAAFFARKEQEKIGKYIGNMISILLVLGIFILLFLQLLPEAMIAKVSGTDNRFYLFLAGLAVIALSLYPYFLGVFQAFRKFLSRTIIEIIFDCLRLGFLGLMILAGLTLGKSIMVYILGAVLAFILIWRLFPYKKIKFNLSLKILKDIFQFSRWLWLVNMIINVYGKMDVLVLTALTSSFVVGQYAAAARLALVFPMATNALNAVVAPRFASFGEKKVNLSYMKKTLLLSLATATVLMGFAVIAKPMVLFIYGARYTETADLFKWLVLVNFPLFLTIPAANSIVYFFQKPSVITGISLLQLMLMAGLTLYLTPLHRAYAPIYGFAVANLLGAIMVYFFFFRLNAQAGK